MWYFWWKAVINWKSQIQINKWTEFANLLHRTEIFVVKFLVSKCPIYFPLALWASKAYCCFYKTRVMHKRFESILYFPLKVQAFVINWSFSFRLLQDKSYDRLHINLFCYSSILWRLLLSAERKLVGRNLLWIS